MFDTEEEAVALIERVERIIERDRSLNGIRLKECSEEFMTRSIVRRRRDEEPLN